MTTLLWQPLADAFLTVGVFVALMLLPFGWVRVRWGHRLDDVLRRHRRLGPVVAAGLTMPPGCGGAIMTMAVYSRGGATYGTAVSALVATMGDASWVLLAHDPWLTAQIKGLLFLLGAATGYSVDAFGYEPHRRDAVRAIDRVTARMTPTALAVGSGPPMTTTPAPPAPLPPNAVVTTAQEGDAAPAPTPETFLGWTTLLFWTAAGAGLLIALPVAFQVVDPATLVRAFGLDPYLTLGAGGALLCVAVFARNRGRSTDEAGCAPPSSMAQVLRSATVEISFITVCVAGAYMAWALLHRTTGFDGSQLPVFGLIGVIVGAAVGLIPGCAVQIVFMGIFVTGGMPLPTLVASSVSQDGDALLPLMALERHSAVVATVITTVPALLAGGVLLALT